MLTTLIVEDHHAIAQLLARLCAQRRLQTTIAPTLARAFDLIDRQRFDLCLLDLILPDGEAFEFISYTQLLQQDVPVFVISNKSDITSRVKALQEGADDFIVKPFSGDEVSLRIQNLLNKTKRSQPRSWQLGDVSFFPEERAAYAQGKRIPLGQRESDLLALLCRRRGYPISRDEILEVVWGSDHGLQPKSVDGYIRRLRQKLNLGPAALETIRGNGYVMRTAII